MSKRRLEQRRIAEAAEKVEKSTAAETKRSTRKTKTAKKAPVRRTKEKAVQRKRLVWCVFNGSMKEEARFPYDQRDAAEERLEQLRAKGTKKLYFLQPVKEAITDSPVTTKAPAIVDVEDDIEDEEAAEAAGGEEEE